MHQDNRYKKQGLARFIQAFVNSGKGFASVWLNESAFRQEVYLRKVMKMVLFGKSFSGTQRDLRHPM